MKKSVNSNKVMLKNFPKTGTIIYQSKSGAIEFKEDLKSETIWANLQQISDLFETDKSGISRHIKNIYVTGELEQKSTVAKIATVQKEGKRKVKRKIEFYDLDVILSVGYRINSKKATVFRKWATKILRQHIINGYTINRKRLIKNYHAFLKAVDEVKRLLPPESNINSVCILELIKMFASTWFSLDAYDRSMLPHQGLTKKQVKITAEELEIAIQNLKNELFTQKEAGYLFAKQKSYGALAGIVGNIFQSFDGKDLYATVEEKAAHLLYFMVKNHPFTDGNKRSGAFAFVWFLKRTEILDVRRITPEALTALTLLIAESKPSDKEKMIGLILVSLNKQYYK